MKCSGCQKEIDYKQTPPIAVGEGEFVHNNQCEEKYYQRLNQQIKKSFAKVKCQQNEKRIV